MAQLIEESLLQAIKKDDIKAFDALMEKAQCGTYRLGRFPVLSLMYLYNSRQIITAYEAKFIKIPSYEELREPVEVSKRFSAKAGKCLRLYLNEVVTPLEMLLILDKTKRLTRIYALTKPSSAVRERLKSIYSIKYSLGVKFEGDNIILDRKPLSSRAKRNIAIICACSVLAVSVTVGVPVTVNAFKVDFSSQNEYTLKRDLVITKPVKEVNCKIIGNGHKIVLKNGVSLGECKGTVSDLTIESSGDAVFTTVYESAVIENVTVNASADVAATEGTALVALTNYGTIDGVTVNVSGSISALAPTAETNADFTFGGVVLSNAFKTQQVYGVIKNCTVNYSQFSLVGEPAADASFGGVAGNNNGYLQDCTVTGEIKADTFDIAGVCSVNNGVLSGIANEADISQTSANTGWNPLASGIALTNNGTVEYCKNGGSISAKSACGQPEGETQVPTVSAAGIVCTNNGTVGACVNGGSVTASGAGAAYVGGIAAQSVGGVYNYHLSGVVSYGGIQNCHSSGYITVNAANPYVGGILGSSEVGGENTIYGTYIYYGIVDHCISESEISVTATGEAPARVGGIAGFVREININNDKDEWLACLGGTVTHCYFTGKFTGKYDTEVYYFGNIIGVCEGYIYENNSYTSGGTEYQNFDGNYYLNNNSSTAFGATVTEDNGFIPVGDKGAKPKTIEDMKDTDAYKAILKALERFYNVK